MFVVRLYSTCLDLLSLSNTAKFYFDPSLPLLFHFFTQSQGPSSATDAFDLPRWETFFTSTIGWRFPCFPLSPATMTAHLLNAPAKKTGWTFTATTLARAQLTQVEPRCTTGWCLPLTLTSGQRDTVRTQHGVTASAGQRRGDVEIRNIAITYGTRLAAGAWSSTSALPMTVMGVAAATPCKMGA
jgi:hypothetical protein